MNYLEQFLKDESYIGILLILDKDLHITDSNNSFKELTGYAEFELSKMKFVDLILPSDKSLFYDVLYDSLVTQDITIKLYNKTGAFRFFSIIVQTFGDHFLVVGNPIKKDFIGYDYHTEMDSFSNEHFNDIEVDDISEFIGFDSEAFLFILDSLPIDIWIKNKYGKYIYVNKTFTSHTGLNYQDTKGKNDFELFEPDIAKEFDASDNTAIESKEQLNYVFESKSDKLLTWTEVTKIPIFNKEEKYIGIIGYSVDISDYKKLESLHKTDAQRYQQLFTRLEDLVFEIDNHGNVLFIAGDLVKDLNIDVKVSNAARLFITRQSNLGIEEKIKLALNGTDVDFLIKIGENDVRINLYPVVNQEGVMNIIGFGKIVGGENE